ncbi:hypothetical protein F503_04031 [Ophiostoma piceae UAMH 11346]|uniref:Uncharacterized protein n=1 Tax=Ophiostoma piceae (strain UAMH 11346) TaxID=1262450 RepID=S3BQN7_OPHP1|nr:hypothetical protein F503_04031 [Ophiostoma piceae UAMH 11346]
MPPNNKPTGNYSWGKIATDVTLLGFGIWAIDTVLKDYETPKKDDKKKSCHLLIFTSCHLTIMALTESDLVALIKMDTKDISPPSEEEKRGFYHGLPTCQRLIGRASSPAYRWASFEDQFLKFLESPNPCHNGCFVPRQAQLLPVGPHRIFEKFQDASFTSMFATCIWWLPWHSVEIYRIGALQDEYRPVVILVRVVHDEMHWGLVRNALIMCKNWLDLVDLGDVDVQICM